MYLQLILSIWAAFDLSIQSMKSVFVTPESLRIAKFVMCNLVSSVYMTFYILPKGCTVPGNQGTHEKLEHIQKLTIEAI